MTICRSTIASALLYVSLAGAAFAQTPRCEPEKASQKYPGYANRSVKISAPPTSRPYSYSELNNPDRLIGVEVEMIENILDCVGLKYEYMKGTWSALLSSLMSGSGDIMIGNINYRPDRAERVDFILYMNVGYSVTTQKGNPKNLGDLGSLCGAAASGVVGGSSTMLVERQSKTCVEQGKAAIQFLPAVDAEAAYRQLLNKRVDFVMDDAVQAVIRVAQHPEFEIIRKVTTDIPSGMVVKKGNSEMLKIVDDGLTALGRGQFVLPIANKYGFPPELLISPEIRK